MPGFCLEGMRETMKAPQNNMSRDRHLNLGRSAYEVVPPFDHHVLPFGVEQRPSRAPYGRTCILTPQYSFPDLQRQSIYIINVYCVSQISPTMCKMLFNIFYFYSLHVSSIHVPIIRRNLQYLCDTGICHSAWVASGEIQPADQTPPIQSDK